MSISSAQLNYLAFAPANNQIASYGNFIQKKNFGGSGPVSELQDLHKNSHESPYRMYGLASLMFSKSGMLTLGTDMGEDFYLRIDAGGVVIDSFAISYIIFGVPPKNVCQNCVAEPYMSGDQCVATCPGNSYPVSYNDGSRGCRACPIAYNLVVNSARTGCVCRTGFVENNGLCTMNLTAFGQMNTTPAATSPVVTVPITTAPIVTPSTTSGGSYVPTTPQQNSQPQVVIPVATPTPAQPQSTSPIVQPAQYTEKNCTAANTYWTGYRCACKVGFATVGGACVSAAFQPDTDIFRPAEFIYKISVLYRNQPATQCPGQN